MIDDAFDILDDLFHGCALAAWLDQAAEEGAWPPDSVATKHRAYRYYEEALAERNGQKDASCSIRGQSEEAMEEEALHPETTRQASSA
jgi:hypothetical protein